MTSTYRTMTVERLGGNATAEDLELFRRACADRQRQTGETDEEVTDYCWNDGDWGRAVEQYA
jgi:hypothetical protein